MGRVVGGAAGGIAAAGLVGLPGATDGLDESDGMAVIDVPPAMGGVVVAVDAGDAAAMLVGTG
ncbi:hypothetical protein [Pseudofrankia asymbiotica]|uniref:hypothetical protein n=1 Tax=Pseudofrankia asymbiotica TaxID=1834516 RepID=UPI001F518507|nr:hypothetical protein [Pseudofrankia asymbiotica]